MTGLTSSGRRLLFPIICFALSASCLPAQTEEDLIGVWTAEFRLAMYGQEEVLDVLEGAMIEFLPDGAFRSRGSFFPCCVRWVVTQRFAPPIPPDGPYNDRYPGWRPAPKPPGPPAFAVTFLAPNEPPVAILSLSKVSHDLLLAVFRPAMHAEGTVPQDPEPSLYVGVLRRATDLDHLPGHD